eukprot:GHVQ01024799.1.p1 GENE.GHVQ01024799.1~~GHVQ01024799.1.p1  ORF type:complete len:472 (+),score=79.12 GHVQ01024799.1:52-1467(+)
MLACLRILMSTCNRRKRISVRRSPAAITLRCVLVDDHCIMRYGQVVIGSAGSGKSTYCSVLQNYCHAVKRICHVINLDPAAEHFDYSPVIDIRDLVCANDVMEELSLGPNGSLVYCLEYLMDNFEWLSEKISHEINDDADDEYVLIDCPGQVELYCHLPIMKNIVTQLERSCNCRLCVVYCLEGTWLEEASKVIAGEILALSAMMSLELPHVSIITKGDLLQIRTRTGGPKHSRAERGGGEEDGRNMEPRKRKSGRGRRQMGGRDDSEKVMGVFCGRPRTSIKSMVFDDNECSADGENDSSEMSELSDIAEDDESEKIELQKFKDSLKGSSMKCGEGEERTSNSASRGNEATAPEPYSRTVSHEGMNLSEGKALERGGCYVIPPPINARDLIEGSLEPTDLLSSLRHSLPPRYKDLNEALVSLLEDFNLVALSAIFNPNSEESISRTLALVDHAIQYGENLDCKAADIDLA